MNDTALREHLARILDWKDAHAGLDAAVKDLPARVHGARPEGLPHSPWELLEHIRLAQRDILEFCVDPGYRERAWPDDYWPSNPAPPDAAAWDESVRAIRVDREALRTLALDQEIDLVAAIPHGSGQTYLRELLLTADHTAYHTGQLVLVRKLLGAWG